MDVVQIIEERLEELQHIAEDDTLSLTERQEAVFEMIAIQQAAGAKDKNNFLGKLKIIFALLNSV